MLDYQNKLEAATDRQLKALPALPAPRSLRAQVMAAIERRAQAAWYRRSWSMWPLIARIGSLSAMLLLFGGLCFEMWRLGQYQAIATGTHKVSLWLSGAGAVLNVIGSLLSAVVVLLKHLGNGVLLGCFAGLALAWAMCMGLGTLCVRLAFARR